jgi:hypothetical protein
VETRKTLGGPAPSETTRALETSRALLASDVRWVAESQERLQRADSLLTEAAARL